MSEPGSKPSAASWGPYISDGLVICAVTTLAALGKIGATEALTVLVAIVGLTGARVRSNGSRLDAAAGSLGAMGLLLLGLTAMLPWRFRS